MTTPTFWMEMTYACDHCGHEERFVLEDGCEGPRDRTVPIVLPADHIAVKYGGAPREIQAPITNSGRPVVPVPFIAGRCPACNLHGRGHEAEGPFGPVRRGYLTHVRWNEDAELNPRPAGVPEMAHFRYPPDPSDHQACGIPVYLAEGVRHA